MSTIIIIGVCGGGGTIQPCWVRSSCSIAYRSSLQVVVALGAIITIKINKSRFVLCY